MRSLALVLAVAARAALAQTFSPGDLARPHAALEGLESCKRCHVAAGQPGAEPCLACHRELAARIRARAGLHGRMPAAEQRACNRCHPEHQGRDFALVDWGPGGKERFAHEKTGYVLAGKHVAQNCESCHDRRLVKDPGVAAALAKGSMQRTFLGLGSACGDCHFDEHRGQEGPSCERCHDARGWKPAPGFDHGKTSFALTGGHVRVPCAKCHAPQQDATTPARAFPAPRAQTFAKLKGLPQACGECHRDPHRGKLGRGCDGCHSTEGWRIMRKELVDVAFHERTRFPLRGLHATVRCQKCHGPFAKAPSRYRNMAFDACTRCHFDAHAGQLGERGAACERCHRVEGFLPVRFEVEDHEASRYPLVGAHRLVACNRCHRQDSAVVERTAAAAREAAAGGRAVRVSAAVLRFTAPLARCESCHADPHVGQLAHWSERGGCAACHEPGSFRAVRFDHEKDSRFALTGKHRSAACASCHRRRQVGDTVAVRYRPLASACVDCHRDAHYGQLGRSCERCHSTDAFEPSRFSHDDPRLTSFALTGRHRRVPCAECHPAVTVDERTVMTRYQPVPPACESCHVDIHRGAFAGFDAAALASTRGEPVEAGALAGTRCAECHTPEAWRSVSFPHELTGWPLRGRHELAQCRSCHRRGLEVRISDACSSCHRDAHAGQFGLRCEGCHDEESWRTRFSADAHRSTAFPLVGRHALLPCTDCHRERRDRGFGHVAVSCYACHARDYQGAALAGVDHVAAGFGTECRQCHGAWRFAPASFPAHDRCFDITGGPHGFIHCTSCHTTLPPSLSVGACATMTAACSSCHEHRCNEMDEEHREVAGYQCADRKCYECHRFN